jgi:hypothetical protein
MFAPFARQAGAAGPGGPAAGEPDKESKPAGSSSGGDINDLKRQMEEIQRRLDRLGNTGK